MPVVQLRFFGDLSDKAPDLTTQNTSLPDITLKCQEHTGWSKDLFEVLDSDWRTVSGDTAIQAGSVLNIRHKQFTGSAVDTTEITLTPDFSIMDVKANDVTIEDSFGELIDNAVNADATEVRVSFGNTDAGEPYIEFHDNGRGMDHDTAKQWAKVGFTQYDGKVAHSAENDAVALDERTRPPPLESFMTRSIGRFGWGATSWYRFGKHVQLRTKVRDSHAESIVVMDGEKIRASGNWSGAEIHKNLDIPASEHAKSYTAIRITQLNREVVEALSAEPALTCADEEEPTIDSLVNRPGQILAYLLATHAMHIGGIPRQFSELYVKALGSRDPLQPKSSSRKSAKRSSSLPTSAAAAAAPTGLVKLWFGKVLVTDELIARLSPMGKLLAAAAKLEELDPDDEAGLARRPTPQAFPLRYCPKEHSELLRHMCLFAWYFPTNHDGKETYPDTAVTEKELSGAAKHMWSYWNMRHMSHLLFGSLKNGFPGFVLKREAVLAKPFLYDRLAMALVLDDKSKPDPNKRSLSALEPLTKALEDGKHIEYWDHTMHKWVPCSGGPWKAGFQKVIEKFVETHSQRCDNDVIFGAMLRLVSQDGGEYEADEVTLPKGHVSVEKNTYISYEVTAPKREVRRGWVQKIIKRDAERTKAFFHIIQDVAAQSNFEQVLKAIKAGAGDWWPVDEWVSNAQVKEIAEGHTEKSQHVASWPAVKDLKHRPHTLTVVDWPSGHVKLDALPQSLQVVMVNSDGDTARFGTSVSNDATSGRALYHGVKLEVLKGKTVVHSETISSPGEHGVYTFSGKVDEVTDDPSRKRTWAETLRAPRCGVGEYTFRFSALRPTLLVVPKVTRTLTVKIGKPSAITGFFPEIEPTLQLGKVLDTPLHITIDDDLHKQLPPADYINDISFAVLLDPAENGNCEPLANPVQYESAGMVVDDSDPWVLHLKGLKIKPFLLPKNLEEAQLRIVARWTCKETGDVLEDTCGRAPLKVTHGAPSRLNHKDIRAARSYTYSQSLEDLELKVEDAGGNLCSKAWVGREFRVTIADLDGLEFTGRRKSFDVRGGYVSITNCLRVQCRNSAQAGLTLKLEETSSSKAVRTLKVDIVVLPPTLSLPVEQTSINGAEGVKVVKIDGSIMEALRKAAANNESQQDIVDAIPGLHETLVEQSDSSVKKSSYLPDGNMATVKQVRSLASALQPGDELAMKWLTLDPQPDDKWYITSLVVDVIAPREVVPQGEELLNNLSEGEVKVMLFDKELGKAAVRHGRATFARLEFSRDQFKSTHTRKNKLTIAPLSFSFASKSGAAAEAEGASAAARRQATRLLLHVWPPQHWEMCRPLLNGVYVGCSISQRFKIDGQHQWITGHLQSYNAEKGTFSATYDDGDASDDLILRTVPFVWLPKENESYSWHDEISVEAGSEFELAFEALDQYFAPFNVPPAVLEQQPQLTCLDGGAALRKSEYRADAPEVSQENPTRAVIRALIKRAGRYRVYCPYPEDTVPSEHHQVKEGEDTVKPLTWHINVKPAETTVLTVNDCRGDASFEAVEGQELALDIRLEDQFRNLHADVTGTLTLSHRDGPVLLSSTGATVDNLDISLQQGAASLSVSLPTPWKDSLPQWPPSATTQASYTLKGTGDIADTSLDVTVDIQPEQYILGVAPRDPCLELQQGTNTTELAALSQLSSPQEYSLDTPIDLRTIAGGADASAALHAFVFVRTSSAALMRCSAVGSLIRTDAPEPSKPRAKRAKTSASRSSKAAQESSEHVSVAGVAVTRKPRPKKQAPDTHKPETCGDEVGILFQFTFEASTWTKAGRYRLEVEVDEFDGPGVSVAFQVQPGTMTQLKMTPDAPAKPPQDSETISVTDFSQQFNLDTFEVCFVDAWGNLTTHGAAAAYDATLCVRIDQGSGEKPAAQADGRQQSLWSAAWTPDSALTVPGNSTPKIHDLVQQQDRLGCYLVVELRLTPRAPAKGAPTVQTIYKVFVSNNEEKRRLEQQLKAHKERLEGSKQTRDAAFRAYGQAQAASNAHRREIQKTEQDIERVITEVLERGRVQLELGNSNHESKCQRLIDELKLLQKSAQPSRRANAPFPPPPQPRNNRLTSQVESAWSWLPHVVTPFQVDEAAASPNLTCWGNFRGDRRGVLGPLCMLGRIEDPNINRLLSDHLRGNVHKILCYTQASFNAVRTFARQQQANGHRGPGISLTNLADPDLDFSRLASTKEVPGSGQRHLDLFAHLQLELCPGFLGFAVNLIHLNAEQLKLTLELPSRRGGSVKLSLRQLWQRFLDPKLLVFQTGEQGKSCKEALQRSGEFNFRYIALDGESYMGGGETTIGNSTAKADPRTMLGFPSQTESFENPADESRLKEKRYCAFWQEKEGQMEALKGRWSSQEGKLGALVAAEEAKHEALTAAKDAHNALTSELEPKIAEIKAQLFSHLPQPTREANGASPYTAAGPSGAPTNQKRAQRSTPAATRPTKAARHT